MRNNFVDERYELIALIFRLAGKPEHSHTSTDYQKLLNERFAEFSTHPTVEHARYFEFGYDAVSRFAIHIIRFNDEFVLIDDRYSLMHRHWTETNVQEFLPLVNQFYTDTNFSTFFQENIPFYEELSERFNRQLYSKLNKKWFTTYGLNPDTFVAIVSPSDCQNGYGCTITDSRWKRVKVCPVLPDMEDYTGHMAILVHEFCHSFSDLKAIGWYTHNEVFRQQCDDSVDNVRLPMYGNGLTMGKEYVTRAHTILYMVENENADPVKLLQMEKSRGFPYIAEVYTLVTYNESVLQPDYFIKYYLGMDYKMGEEEHSFHVSNEHGNRIVRWRFIDLLGQQICIENFSRSQVGNIHGTKTGDVIFVMDGLHYFLYVDIGPADDWSPNHRSYHVFSF
ncbi:MAG: DUF4932 domain-containing protein [Firmicutes bacterium]|nr:DUF4932 domain-containing protein [Bacillota bacterium]